MIMPTATTASKSLAEMSLAELAEENIHISNLLDTPGLAENWTHDHKARALLSRRRQIRDRMQSIRTSPMYQKLALILLQGAC
jgi:hypothetical protein